MRPLAAILLACALLPVAACSSLRASVSERFLLPRDDWIAEPGDLGLAFEPFELETGPGTSVTGWFIPSASSGGRTVVVCHGNAANISYYHPYYRLLHDAGFHVALFDYRGFGRSRGDVDVGALFDDTLAVLDHVLARPDVDRRRVALFGLSLGSIVALRVAAERPDVAAVVVEDVVSPRAALRAGLGGFGAWVVEALALPGGIESSENAARVAQPSLYVCGQRDPGLADHLRAWSAARGPAACWVMPDAAHAPNGLMAQDGEYQRGIVRFLAAALEGRTPRVDVRRLAGAPPRVRLEARDLEVGAGLPVEVCAVDEAGGAAFERRFLRAAQEEWTLELPFEPAWISAWPYTAVAPPADGERWTKPLLGPLAGAEEALNALSSFAALVPASSRPLVTARGFVEELERRGAFAPELEAELVPAYLTVGRELLASDAEADRALGRALLRRCVAAAPEKPALHVWPATRYVAGFQHGAQVEEARRLLAGSAP